MEIDHVLIAVTDLARADRNMERQFGLRSIEGGRHPGWGTANRIVPLGETYLELVAAVDNIEAANSQFGRWVESRASGQGTPLGWAVRTNDLDSVARRLGLAVRPGQRLTPAGEILSWRSAGIEQAAQDPSVPFFIQWSADSHHPGETPIAHPVGPARLAQLLLQGDPDRMARWLGDNRLPITVASGSPAVASIVVAAGDREIRIA